MSRIGAVVRPSSLELVLDHRRHRDQLVHVRRQVAQHVAILLGPDAAGVDGRDTTYGRRWPISPRAIAARVPTVSARYMWLWMTSARTSARCAASAPTAIASSGSSMTRTSKPARCSLRTALPGRQRHDRDVVAVRVHPGDEPVQVLLGAAVRAGREDLDDADPTCRPSAPSGTVSRQGSGGSGAGAHQAPRRTSSRWMGSSTAPHSYL